MGHISPCFRWKLEPQPGFLNAPQHRQFVLVTSGLRNEVNAYRSELQGCHAGLLGLLAFCIYYDIHEGSITFHFDNDAGLDKAAEGHLKVSTKYKHSDLIRAI
jgi:hypothetical protein